MIYATWSQGFRRGGSNSYILQGPLAESPTLLSYRPDKKDNFEVGFKGRLGSEFTYSLAAFDIEWKDPQIGVILIDGGLQHIEIAVTQSR